jgi:hypothetical protein
MSAGLTMEWLAGGRQPRLSCLPVQSVAQVSARPTGTTHILFAINIDMLCILQLPWQR